MFMHGKNCRLEKSTKVIIELLTMFEKCGGVIWVMFQQGEGVGWVTFHKCEGWSSDVLAV